MFLAHILYIISVMKVAIPNWHGRISPVLDVAGRVLLVDLENSREKYRVEMNLLYSNPFARARQFAEFNTNVIICDAVSGQLEWALRSSGVQVLANICGSVEGVLQAYMSRSLGGNGRRRRLRCRHR